MAQTNNSSNELTNIELSIQLSLSGLSFCILNRNLNSIINLGEFQFEKKLNPLELLDRLKELFNNQKALSYDFSKVSVIHDNDLSALVPQSLFSEDCLADYLKFNSKILKSDYITFDTISENDSVNVYVPYININNFIYDKFGAFTFKHISTVLIENILQIEKNKLNTRVYIHVSTGHFEIVVVENSKLKLYNTFTYGSKEDFIYYILFTAEQLNLNPETLKLVFLGQIEKGDKLYEIAYKYIRNISFGSRNDTFKFEKQPKTGYSNFTLINNF
ncbi:DUF3822 family protein [Tamlana sp. 2_MG-2023]|uniref:DUF3822 family protein n=1 Tax=unclassified Tamlana TaxID=2614803 RepID=UPI0026E23957|nr:MULTISPECIES: DUF3822 family protein [unclassified Tamlana]MDO6759559.1 DUF3822 family protein [Tamlana sp. 2_MG-2023]MDO6790302.1 DUF3822 family protein [Tamlana sp. 1_MG-2023]